MIFKLDLCLVDVALGTGHSRWSGSSFRSARLHGLRASQGLGLPAPTSPSAATRPRPRQPPRGAEELDLRVSGYTRLTYGVTWPWALWFRHRRPPWDRQSSLHRAVPPRARRPWALRIRPQQLARAASRFRGQAPERPRPRQPHAFGRAAQLQRGRHAHGSPMAWVGCACDDANVFTWPPGPPGFGLAD